MAARSPSTYEHLKISGVGKTGEEIGRGAYGSVSAVEYYGVTCAAKEVHSILLEFVGPDERERMIESVMKECHLLSSLRHPNVISFIGIFYRNTSARDRSGPPQAPVLVMELMQYSLSSLLEKYQAIPMYVKAPILYDVSAGLSYLHGQSIVHRCICSNDILLGNHLEAKIADFGVATKIEPGKRRTLTQCPGVVDFMPPEALGSRPVYGLPLDVFSYGGVIIHGITQQWPHPTAHMELNPATGKQVLVTEVERRRKYLDMMAITANELVSLTSSCLKTDPKHRPATSALCLEMKMIMDKYTKANKSPITWLVKNLEPEVNKVPHPPAADKDIPSILHSHVLSGVTPTGQDIGHGSYGIVYEVNYNGKACAAKEVHSIFVGADGFPKMKEDFVRECHLWSTLLHPNIVQFLGVYYPPQNESGLPVLVMEKMWESLTSLAEKHGNIPLHVKLSILVDVSLGLRYLHNRVPPVIHCDLSPNNILVGFRLEAKITDLGVAKVVKAGGSTKTMTKAPGTADFMPPEAVADRPIYGPPLDVFSFGGIIIHIMTQQWPRPLSWVHIDSKTREQRLLSEVERRQHYLDQINAPDGLCTLAASCLNGDPECRPVIKAVADKIGSLKYDYGKQNEIDWRDLISWLTDKK